MKPATRFVLFAIAALPLAGIIYLVILFVRREWAQAFFYLYVSTGLIVGILCCLVWLVISRTNIIHAASRINVKTAQARFIRSLTLSIRLAGIILNWPALILIVWLNVKRSVAANGFVKKMQQQLSSDSKVIEDGVVLNPAFSLAASACLAIMTSHAHKSFYIKEFYFLLLASVMVRHLATICEEGKLLVQLKKLPGQPLVRFIVILLCDYISLVILLSGLRTWSYSAIWRWQQAKEVAAMLRNPLAIFHMAVPEFRGGAFQHVWHLPAADKAVVAGGLLLYIVVLRTAAGGLSEFKRTDEDKIAVANMLFLRAEYVGAEAMLKTVQSMSVAREALRAKMELALGHPAKACNAARRVLEEATSGDVENPSNDDLYFYMLKEGSLTELPASADLALWKWGLQHGVSCANLVNHFMQIGQKVKEIEHLTPFLDDVLLQVCPAVISLNHLLRWNWKSALECLPQTSPVAPEDKLLHLAIWFGATFRSTPKDERGAFAAIFFEQWKEAVLAWNRSLSEAGGWKCLAAVSCNSLLYEVVKLEAKEQAGWLDRERQELLVSAISHEAGGSDLAPVVRGIMQREFS